MVSERNHPQVAAMFDVIYIYGIILQYSKLLNIKCHHDVSSIHREFIAAQ